jgi:hypothetical protein
MTTARIPLLHRYANPAAFGRLAAQILPWTAGASAILLGLGLYFALFASPPDYQQGESVRIMYVHVPAAIMSEIVYGLMAAAAAAGIIWKHALADLFVKAAAPLGAAFTLICLVAGSLWGKPMWGAWWVWDARLTSELVLFFLYLGYLALVDAFDDPQRGLKAGAILVLVEHAAPAGQPDDPVRPQGRPQHAAAADADDRRLHHLLHHHGADAAGKRVAGPPHPRLAHRRRGRMSGDAALSRLLNRYS